MCLLCKETPYRRHEDGSIYFERKDDTFEAGFSIKDMSHCLGVSESTLYCLIRVYNITKRQHNELDTVVNEILADFPGCGEEMLQQLLRWRGIKVSRLLLTSIVFCIK